MDKSLRRSMSARIAHLTLVATLALASSPAFAARDPKAAKAAVDAATTAMGRKDYETAAVEMERAWEFDPNPLWLANAGYARMMAGEQDRAVDLLSKAVADPKLTGEGRNRAVERLSKASAARAHLESSQKAIARSDFDAAARSLDDAYAAVPIGEYALAAALAWEKAKRPAEARSRLEVALASGELGAADMATATKAQARLKGGRAVETKPPDVPLDVPKNVPPNMSRNVPPEAPSPDGGSSVAGWALVGSGVAVLGGGAAFFALGEAAVSDLRDAQARAEEGVVTEMSRARAVGLVSDVGTYRTLGVIGTVAGLALSTTGVVLLAIDAGTPDRESVVQIGADLRATRWMLTAGWRW